MPDSPEAAWVRLSPELRKRETKSDGVEVFVSPYDVPEAVRGRYDEKAKRFVIEFKYLDDEKASGEHEGEPVALRVGKNSGRLFGIQIDVEALKSKDNAVLLGAVTEFIANAMTAFQAKPKPDVSRLDNYQVAKEVITDRSAQLFQELVKA
jgi:hypothetical protein